MPAATLLCPACGNRELDARSYESMIMVSANLALFTVRCPKCDARVSGLRSIPPEMIEEVHFAAIEVGAGMGRNS